MVRGASPGKGHPGCQGGRKNRASKAQAGQECGSEKGKNTWHILETITVSEAWSVVSKGQSGQDELEARGAARQGRTLENRLGTLPLAPREGGEALEAEVATI